jgi:tricorn protease
MRRLLLTSLFVSASLFASPRPLLMRFPTVSATQIAFAWAGQIWTVSRDGGMARRLVAGSARLTAPIFSPDGSMIAYTGDYDGNRDVYVVPAAGGQPRRLTWHPGDDTAIAWTPDGKRIAFRSDRARTNDPEQMFTVSVDGGPATAVPLPAVQEASYSPDGTRVAYQPNLQWQPAWKGYRGGQTRRIFIASLADSSIVRIPQENNSNDSNPLWIGDKIYFLSDRKGPLALYAYDVNTKSITPVVPNTGLDIASAGAGAGAIVYVQPGSLHLVDLATGSAKTVPVDVAADLPQSTPHFEKIDPAKDIRNYAISPTGQRAVFEAHGEIVTVPAKKGDIRNLTRTAGAAERDPAWSPDGQSIAYFSDESGEYALVIRSQTGLGAPRVINLGNPPSFFYTPVWSPDSKRIAFSDKRLNLWMADLRTGKITLVDTDRFDSPVREFDPAWSPDSRWIAYTKLLPSQLHAAYVYDVNTAKATQVTDGMSDALYPKFDAGGKYLYFTASTDVGLNSGWLDMSSIGRPETRNVYAAVLRKDLPSPVPLQSDEEKAAAPAPEEKKPAEKSDDRTSAKGDEAAKPAKTPPAVTIDFDGLGQRVVSLPIPARNYRDLQVGKEGVIFLAEAPIVVVSDDPPTYDISRFDLEKREVTPIVKGVFAFALSQDGTKMLYRSGSNWTIADSEKAPSGSEPPLSLGKLEVYVDPPAEWRQMYNEVWRIERDFLYDKNFHGLDLAAAKKAYEPFLAGVGSRDDLTYLFAEMTGNLSLGHTFVGSGIRPPVPTVHVGLLGADYTLDQGRYRFARIYNGENWNPDLRAPLTEPGVVVHEGEYLLAVNGKELHATDEIYSFFLDTAGVQTSIRVGPNADGTGARDVTVVPVPDELGVRNLAWIESNRRKVDRMSGGRVAYIYLPDTANGGYTNFNRYFFSQVGREGAVIDERFNHGGDLADYIIDLLRRPPMSLVMSREGEDSIEPIGAIFGPKAMIINQFAGSGGDAMPWYFKRTGIGPLVGERTWGGLVGIGNYPVLMDGGRITAPRWAIYGLNKQWEVENVGIAPDIEVFQDPKLVREGRDPQLERAVAYVMDELQKHPLPKYDRPPTPVYSHPLPRNDER